MKILLTGLLAASLLILMMGCSDDDDSNPPVNPTDEVQLSVSVNPDTIWFVYGETVVTEINVLVTDGSGLPLAGRPVMVHVSDSDVGEVDFETMGGNHSTAWDTTDSAGRAVIPYLAVRSGGNVITAVAEGDTAQTVAVGRYPYSGTMLTLSLTVSPTLWNFSISGDTARIQCNVTVLGELQLPVPGLLIEFAAQHGQMGVSLPTDENGHTEAWLTATEDEIFPDPLIPESNSAVYAQIGIFDDVQLILFRHD